MEEKLQRTNALINQKYAEYFIPTLMTALANNIAVMVDATIVGNLLGSAALAAVNLLSPVVQLYFSLSILFGLGSSTIMARLKGKYGNDNRTCNGIFTLVTLAVAVISVLLLAIQLMYIDTFVGLLATASELQELVRSYYIPIIIGTPITLIMTSGIYIVRTEGNPKLASRIIIISNLINLVMDLVMIQIFHLGIMGASIATVIGNFIGLLVLLHFFFRKNTTLAFDLSIFKNMQELIENSINILTTGFSGAMGTLLVTVRMLFINTIIQQYGGKSAMVAYSVVMMIQIFVSAFVTGACQTMIPIVSMLLGEKDYGGIKIAFKRALQILLISSFFITIVAELFPTFIINIYGVSSAEDVEVAVQALNISSLLFPALAMSFLGLYYFMSTGRKTAATAVSIVNGVVLIIPCGYVFSKLWGITGVWWSLVAAQVGTFLFAISIAFITMKICKKKYANMYLLEEGLHNEVLAFSVQGKETDFSTIYEKIRNKTNNVMANYTMQILKILCEAPLEKGKNQNNTDVCIFMSEQLEIIFKNSGASVQSDLFENINNVDKSCKITYSKVMGFNQICVLCNL